MSRLDQIIDNYKAKKGRYEDLARTIVKIVESSIPSEVKIIQITSRVKDEESLREKIIDKEGTENEYTQISDIKDIVGVRIITYFNEDIDTILSYIRENLDVDEDNSPDFRKIREEKVDFGYLSSHLVISLGKHRSQNIEYAEISEIPCEIQVRSILQHSWAQIEHGLGYKSKKEVPDKFRRKFLMVAAILENADNLFSELKQISESLTPKSNNTPEDPDEDSKQDHNSSNSTPLDKNNLNYFINQNPIMEKIRTDLIKEKVTESFVITDDFYNYDPFEFDYLTELEILNIQTIENLEEIMNHHSKDIINYIIKTLSNQGYRELKNSLPLFYLLHIKSAIKGDDYLFEYVKRNRLGDRNNRKETMLKIKKDVNNIIKPPEL